MMYHVRQMGVRSRNYFATGYETAADDRLSGTSDVRIFGVIY